MFTTSLAAVAVAGLFASGSLSGQPDWAPSYASALSRAAELRKPVAVFITPGSLAQLTKGTGLGSDASKTLHSHYIAVQIDATTEAGKKMAESFGIKEGVVISDRTGDVMALRHEGAVTQADLNGYLTKFSGQTTVAVTEHYSSVAPVYQPQMIQNRPVLNAVQNFNTAVFGQPLIGSS